MSNAIGGRFGRYGHWDHLHKKMEVFPYEFSSAVQLIEDFWQSAEQYIENH